MDIFGDIPDRDYDEILFEIRIGKTFLIHAQRQEGFIRAACYTDKSARWISPILVDDHENFEMLFATVCEDILDKSRPPKPGKLRLVE